LLEYFTVEYAPCMKFLLFFDPPAGKPQGKETDYTGRRRDRWLLFFSRVWKEGLPAVSFLSSSNTAKLVEVGQTKLSFTGSLTLTFSIHVFFFGPRELFTYPPDVPYPIIM